MSIYDKNLKRIREIQLQVAKGKTTADRAAARIARIHAQGPEWWVKGRAYGKWFDLQVPAEFIGKKGAKEYDSRVRIKVVDRTFTPSELLKTRLRVLFEAHRDAQAGRGGHKAATTLCKHAIRYFGMLRLDGLQDKPKVTLAEGFKRVPGPPLWKVGTRNNLRAFMRAAIGRYLRENPRLVMNNPMDAYPPEDGEESREVFPTLTEHRTLIHYLRANPYRIVPREKGLGPVKTGYPSYLAPLMVIKYEQGLRGMEIIPWRLEHLDMDCAFGALPAVETFILKKNGKRAKQWVVLTPDAFDAMKAYLATIPGPKERGPVWPVKNFPYDIIRRALDACGLSHLNPHDWRTAWTMNHIDEPGERRRAAIGKESEEGEAAYKVFNRQQQEVLYRPKWAHRESSALRAWDQDGDQND